MIRIDMLRAALLLSAITVTPTFAQQTAPPAQTPPAGVGDAPDGPNSAGDEIVVTGTSIARKAFDTPLSVTTLDEGTLARTTATSVADILNTIPTIKSDGGGGEVAANVFVRGLPSGGQYQFTPLMYDGIPVLSTFGLNSSAYDVYFRNDLGIERLEFVRGGVSNLFGPGSVAGLINFISKTGSATYGGVAQVEVAERGRVRGDVAVSGPLAERTFFALSGYYRYDEGTIRTGLKTDGWQIRANLRQEFADGSGSVALFGQYIDDQVQFFLPIPLNGSARTRARGNGGDLVDSVQNRFNPAALGFATPDGRFESDINKGVYTRGGQIALVFDKELGSGWGVNGRVKYSEWSHKFGIWADGDGLINVPETLQGFLTNRGLGSLANARFTFADGSAAPANTILFANRFTDRDRPAHDFSAEFNVTKKLETGSLEHNLTLGGFYGDATADDINVTTTYLAEFDNRPRLVNLTTINPVTGAQTIVTRNGLLNAGAGYVNNRHSAERYAVYFADQIEADRFSFDIGARIEHFTGDIRRERTATFVTDATTPGLSTALRDVIWGNDTFQSGRVSTTEWALAGGLLYKASPEVNLYLNGSRGYFFPEIRSVTFNALGRPASFEGEIIYQGEGGVKWDRGRLQATLAGYYTNLQNRRQVLFVNDGQGGFIERVNLVSTESYGMEATLNARLTRHLRFAGNLTWQAAYYTAFDTTPGFVGNDLERQPAVLWNAGAFYDDGRFDFSLFSNYTGPLWTAANNAIRLDGFNILNLDGGFKLPVGTGRSVRFGVNVFNLLDEDAVTEGSPRQDINQVAGGQFFVGRPVLPRRVTGRVTFNF